MSASWAVILLNKTIIAGVGELTFILFISSIILIYNYNINIR